MQYWTGYLVASCLALSSLQDKQPAPQPAAQQTLHTVQRPLNAGALFARFAKMKGLQISFTEKKYLALLAVPLKSEGTLYFLPPGHLTRLVSSPSESRLTITPDSLKLTNRDGVESMDLRQNPDLQAFVTSLVRVFAGDKKQLQLAYKMTYSLDEKDSTKWSLLLQPLKKPLTEMMQSLRLDGSGSAVTSIEIREPNGDRTVTTVSKANPAREFTDQEKFELFSIPLPEPKASDH
jgi:hypothetical protein